MTILHNKTYGGLLESHNYVNTSFEIRKLNKNQEEYQRLQKRETEMLQREQYIFKPKGFPLVENTIKMLEMSNKIDQLDQELTIKKHFVELINKNNKKELVEEYQRMVFGKHQDKNVNHTDSATTVNNVVSAKGEALVQPVLPEYKEPTSTGSKEENKPQNKVAALVNEKPEFPLEELEKLKKEQDALNKKEATESKQENKKDNLLDKKNELKDKLTDAKEDIKKESKDLLKGLKDESTPKGSDLFDNLANKSSSHSNENTPRIEKKELPKTSSTNSSGLAGVGALGVGLGAVIATRKKKLNR